MFLHTYWRGRLLKRFIVFLSMIVLILLVACSSSKTVTDYVGVSFSGIDSIGSADYSLDEDKLFADIFDFEPETDSFDDKKLEEISTIASAYTIELDKHQELSNGDTVTLTVSVDKDKTKKIKGGDLEVTVEGLEDALDIMPYVDVSFSGLDSQGTAEAEMNEDALINDVFGHDLHDQQEIEEDINNLITAYSIELDQDQDLANGDTVTLTVAVDEGQSKIIEGGEKEFTVSQLEEATELTTEEVEKHLVLNFNGVSGKGTAQMDNTFSSPLSHFDFNIENDGSLENGDEATLVRDEETKRSLNNEGYIVTEDFNPTFEVEGLDVVAEKATDIANLEDIERVIDEQVNRSFEDHDPEETYGIRYDIELEKLMYRQFDQEEDDWYGQADHGVLIGIYSVEKYDGGDNGELQETFTAVVGNSDIYLDEDDEANISQIDSFMDRKDDSYSLKSVIQLYEGNGYEEVEK